MTLSASRSQMLPPAHSLRWRFCLPRAQIPCRLTPFGSINTISKKMGYATCSFPKPVPLICSDAAVAALTAATAGVHRPERHELRCRNLRRKTPAL